MRVHCIALQRITHKFHSPSGTLVSRRDDAAPGPLLVSLLDGQLVALDRQSGQQLWTLRTGPSLVSTWTAPMGSQAQQCASDLHHAAGGDTCEEQAPVPGIQVFPGLDGSLFMAHTTDGSLENVQVVYHWVMCLSYTAPLQTPQLHHHHHHHIFSDFH